MAQQYEQRNATATSRIETFFDWLSKCQKGFVIDLGPLSGWPKPDKDILVEQLPTCVKTRKLLTLVACYFIRHSRARDVHNCYTQNILLHK